VVFFPATRNFFSFGKEIKQL